MEELIKIQSELKAPKGQYNTFGKYKYRSCEDILEAVKPLLKANGCTLTITDDIVPVGDRVYVKATCRLVNKEGKEETTTAYAREVDTKTGMDVAQVTGAASSYARKYALNGLFCIDDTKDTDMLDNTNSNANPYADTLALAIQEIKAAQSRDTLKSIYANYKASLGTDKRFLDEINTRAAQLGLTPKHK